MRKIFHIIVLLLLGGYYNSVPIAWISYETFAEHAFASHCVNPNIPTCHGKCQIVAMEEKNKTSSNSKNFQLSLPIYHPPLPVTTNSSQTELLHHGKISFCHSDDSILAGNKLLPFHPPKIS